VQINSAIQSIVSARNRVPAHRSLLVAISGIDGSGKGYVTARLAALLSHQKLRVARALLSLEKSST
jgi:uridine kinase